jgi:hypothetical protein
MAKAAIGTAGVLGDTNAFKVGRVLWHSREFTVAESVPDLHGDTDVGVTWNPGDDRPCGYPNSRGYQQWFILPQAIGRMLLAAKELEPDSPAMKP